MVDRPTLSELIASAETDIDGKLAGAESRLRRSLLSVVVRVLAGLAYALYDFVLAQFKNVFTKTMDEEHLRQEASDYGLAPNPATFATGTVTVTGVNGTPITTAAVLRRADGVLFDVTANTSIVAGTASLTVQAEDAGVAGNTTAGASLTFVSPIGGVSSSGTVAGGGLTGGADEESVDSLRDRLLFRKRNPPKGGADTDYKQWMSEAITGVTRSWVLPGWNGAGTVGLTFALDGRVDPIPTGGDVAAMLSYIDVLRPVTATPVVFACTPDAVPFSLSVTPNTLAVKNAVAAELKDLIQREGQPSGTLLLTHIREAISTAPGVTDYTLTSPAANVVSAAGHLPVMGAITWL